MIIKPNKPPPPPRASQGRALAYLYFLRMHARIATYTVDVWGVEIMQPNPRRRRQLGFHLPFFFFRKRKREMAKFEKE